MERTANTMIRKTAAELGTRHTAHEAFAPFSFAWLLVWNPLRRSLVHRVQELRRQRKLGSPG